MLKRLSFGFNFILLILSMFLQNIIPLFFLGIIYNANLKILDFEYHELLLIYGISRISYGMFYLIFSNLFSFGYTYLIKGNIEKHILKPFSTFWLICLENINITKVMEVILGFIIVGYTLDKVSIVQNSYFIFLLTLYTMISTIIISAFYILLSTLSFHIKNFNFINIFNSIEMIGIYPLAIYSMPIKIIFTFLIPFLFAGSIPFYMLNHFNLSLLLIYIGIAFVFSFSAYAFWNGSIKKYDGVGF